MYVYIYDYIRLYRYIYMYDVCLSLYIYICWLLMIMRVYRLTTLVWCPSKMFICSIYFTIDNVYPTPHCFRTKQNSPKTDCLVVEPTPLKNMTSSVGMMTFPTEWKVIKFHGSKHFQTNQQKKAFTKNKNDSNCPKTVQGLLLLLRRKHRIHKPFPRHEIPQQRSPGVVVPPHKLNMVERCKETWKNMLKSWNIKKQRTSTV